MGRQDLTVSRAWKEVRINQTFTNPEKRAQASKHGQRSVRLLGCNYLICDAVHRINPNSNPQLFLTPIVIKTRIADAKSTGRGKRRLWYHLLTTTPRLSCFDKTG